MLNYEEALNSFERDLNSNMCRDRVGLLNRFNDFKKNGDEKNKLTNILKNMDSLSEKVNKNKTDVLNLRTEIDEIENKNKRMAQKDENCLNIVEIAEQMLSFNKLKDNK